MKRIAICVHCGKKFEIQDDLSDYYVCDECKTKTFPGPQK